MYPLLRDVQHSLRYFSLLTHDWIFRETFPWQMSQCTFVHWRNLFSFVFPIVASDAFLELRVPRINPFTVHFLRFCEAFQIWLRFGRLAFGEDGALAYTGVAVAFQVFLYRCLTIWVTLSTGKFHRFDWMKPNWWTLGAQLRRILWVMWYSFISS